ncbi:MAG: iron ABC transporter permease [Limnochordaceae bacterium]|nr:iron ABC transporter permease [Limnochordaceae bacterium]
MLQAHAASASAPAPFVRVQRWLARRAAPWPGLGWAVLAAGLAGAAVLAARWGSIGVTWADVARGVLGGMTGEPLEGRAAIVWQLRVPRVLAGMLAGAALGVSGAALQGLFRNPLADPYLMGVAPGAIFGVAVALSVAGAAAPAFAGKVAAAQAAAYVPAAAFVGALGAVLAAVVLAHTAGGRRTTDLVLAGVVVGSVLTAATTYLMLRDADRIRSVFAWTLGNLSLVGWPELGAALPYGVAGMLPLLGAGRVLNAMQLGEDVAQSLGIPVQRLKLGLIAAASLATAAVVSQVGVIGFVGLVVPHAVRRLAGSDYRTVLPASALGGAMLLVLADLVARMAARPAELPVGVVTALVGGPFFLYLLRKGHGHAPS